MHAPLSTALVFRRRPTDKGYGTISVSRRGQRRVRMAAFVGVASLAVGGVVAITPGGRLGRARHRARLTRGCQQHDRPILPTLP